MARFIRGSLVLGLLLVTACRFSAARQEALFRFAISAVLRAAATTEVPETAQPVRQAFAAQSANAGQVSPCRWRAAAREASIQAAAADVPMIGSTPHADRVAYASLRVNAINIAAAELRPAVQVVEPLLRSQAISLERRMLLLHTRVVRYEVRRIVREAENARCNETRARDEETLRELRAHIILPDDGKSCLVDPDAWLSLPASATESESLQTIGG